MKLFLDVNVVLDVLLDRSPFAADSSAVLSAIERDEARGWIAGHTPTTLFYLMRRHLGPKPARRALVDLLRLVDVIAVDEDRLLHALALGWDDFEDAVQAACALKGEADYLVTRDKEGFAGSDVPAITPSELLPLLRGSPG